MVVIGGEAGSISEIIWRVRRPVGGSLKTRWMCKGIL